MQQTWTTEMTEGGLDPFQVGSRIARFLGWLKKDSQALAGKVAVQQGLCGLGVPNACFYSDPLVE